MRPVDMPRDGSRPERRPDVYYYPERLEEIPPPRELTPSQAVRMAEDPLLLTDGSAAAPSRRLVTSPQPLRTAPKPRPVATPAARPRQTRPVLPAPPEVAPAAPETPTSQVFAPPAAPRLPWWRRLFGRRRGRHVR